ncbi:hypothetical protein LguiB_014183 [Lonicera macranthoides]
MSSVYTNLVLTTFIGLLNLAISTPTYTNETDVHALLAFKSNFQDPLGALNSWNDSVHFCSWQGVSCGRRHRRVTALNLISTGLVGPLSPYLGNLSFIREMVIFNNSLQGEIPPQIGRLFRLQRLQLPRNSLKGKIPTNLSRLSSLELLNLGYNKLEGGIPRELGGLPKLRGLQLSFNNLRGEIPSSIGNLTSLQLLYIAFNGLVGSIPDIFGQQQNLMEIGLGSNNLSGTIPLSIFNLSWLTNLSLADNGIGGTLPQNLGLRLPRLKVIQLWGNRLTGTIPISLSNASDLEQIEFSKNNFVGKVPTNLGSLERLRVLVLESNSLGRGDADDVNFLSSLTNCTVLEAFSVVSNRLGGTLPNSVGNLSIQLRYFGVAVNQMYGEIPLGFGNLANIERLELGNNQFEGQIPYDIGKIQKLNRFHLAVTRVSGQIPFSLGNLSFLSLVYLANNALEGTIPSSIGKCKNLILLTLSENNLSGTIPKELFSASALSISLDLAGNNLVGSMPPEVGNLKFLVEFDASENKLSGEIPIELGNCISLVNISLKGNFFQGSIPLTFKSLRSVQNLDLSRNNLSGTVPIFLESFSLHSLNLSFNKFEGELPTKGVFSNAGAISIEDNNGVCGGIYELRLPKCNKTSLKKRLLSSLYIVLIVLGSLLIVVFMVSSFIIFFLKKKKREQSSSGSLRKELFLKVSYGDLLKATNGFSSTNLIGVGSFGSVYKGMLDHDNTEVAVKVLNLERQGASKSFIVECETLGNIRHRNLVKIITLCSSIDFQGNDFKALVYEFMPNGSLEKWFHYNGQEEPRKLNLKQKIHIAIDVASALNYLHHQCEEPIIHCDLKPSNVLLDSDMVAHVGDFGLAKFCLPELLVANQSSSIGIRGTIGYAAPEYGLGSEVSMNGDIYSYGILLLEMITERSPVDPLFDNGFSLHNYALKALPDRVMEIVKPKLQSNSEEEVLPTTSNNKLSGEESSKGNKMKDCLISMIKIGVACSLESPQNRMDLSDVIRELYSIQRILEEIEVEC